MSKAALTEVRVRILRDTQMLRSQPIDHLRSFVETPLKEQLQIQQTSIEMTTWAQQHGEGKLAVIVEARRKRFLGWSQVTADGFYKTSDGAVTDFREKDYWDHGY